MLPEPSPLCQNAVMPSPSTDRSVVLVPIEFSPGSSAALRWAAEAVAGRPQTIEVLHVVHVPAHDLDFYSRAFGDDAVHTLQEQASRLLDQFLDDEAAASPAVAALGSLPCHMATGVPSTRIIELAERIGARRRAWFA